MFLLMTTSLIPFYSSFYFHDVISLLGFEVSDHLSDVVKMMARYSYGVGRRQGLRHWTFMEAFTLSYIKLITVC